MSLASASLSAAQLLTIGLLFVVTIVVVSFFFDSPDPKDKKSTGRGKGDESDDSSLSKGFRFFTADPEKTGIKRPLWGPLYPKPSTIDVVRPPMSTLPWCTTPMNGGPMCDKVQRELRSKGFTLPDVPFVPYEFDKI